MVGEKMQTSSSSNPGEPAEQDIRLFDLSPVPMWIVDSKTKKFLRVNQTATRLYGYDQNEFQNLTTDDLLCRDTPIHSQKIVTHRKKDGGRILVETTAATITHDGRECLLVAAYDVTERSTARALIETERENFRNLFKQIPEMICTLRGPEHIFDFVNESYVKMLGFNPTTMRLREAQRESSEVHEIVDEVYRTGKTTLLREIPMTISGRLGYFNLTYTARRDEQGCIDGVMVLGTEITNQILSRESYKFQKNALELALDGAPLPEVLESLARMIEFQAGTGVLASILLLDEDGKRLNFGAAPGLSADYNNKVHGLLIGPDAGSCGTAAYTGQRVIVEDIATDPKWRAFKDLAAIYDLKSCWAMPIISSKQKVIGTCSFYSRVTRRPSEKELQIIEVAAKTIAIIIERQREISEHLTSVKALQESEDRLNLALIAGDIGFWDWNAKSGHVAISKTLMTTWGLNPLNFQNTLAECLALIHPDDRDRVWAEINKSAKHNIPHDVEFRLIRPSGEVIWLNAKGQYYLDEEGDPARLTGIMINITDRVHASWELQRAKDEAVRANELKSAFLANMSHEIRTPLGAMIGFADLLRDRSLTEQKRSSYIDILVRNGEQLSVIINDILDLSKVEAGHLSLEFSDVSPAKIAEDVLSSLRVTAVEKALDLEYVADPSTPQLLVTDPTRLRQILFNLIGNSIKFTQRGSISVRSYGCKSSTGYPSVCFEVKDTGIGISPSHKDQLFEMFVQGDGSMTRRFGGTGLGLALSRRLARALGGDVMVLESEEGAGTTFKVAVEDRLDLRSREPRTDEYHVHKSITIKPNELENVRVLVIDDAPDNRELITHYLAKRGALVDSATNGLLGYKQALEKQYDLVLMDIQMPEMDGYTATEKLRAAGYSKPIIALTAHAMSEVRKKCLNVGCNEHLPKPINPHDLIRLAAKFTVHRASAP